ncbi:MAG: ABC transporter substrate-binding protein [Patescibacteria group bacterium]
MKKIAVIIAALVVVVGLGVWFAKDNTAAQPLRIGLNPWIGNGIFNVAQEKGIYEANGLKVVHTNYDDGAVGKQLFASGKIDVLVLTSETVATLHDAGVKVKVVGSYDASLGADGIIAAEGINSLADLRGKKVAYEEGSPSHFFLALMLEKQGMSTKDVQTVNMIASDAGAAFVAGKVDAAVTWEPWLSKASERKGGHVIASTKTSPILDIVIVREEVLQERRAEIVALMRSIFATREYIITNPDESYAVIAKGLAISEQDVRDQIPTFRWMSLQDNAEVLTKGEYSAVNLLDKASTLWFDLGLTKTRLDAKSIVDTSIIEELL